ncbi:APC family permease [Blastomonas sp.]|uniref:APC family permease n=1 Tax=Blastomonas sp. TaxID=1909299 RepID=UPI00261CC4F9|nr:APC family permease [Blastomonas sp.]MDM7957555.1 APC family permease [Blastomonas sp.]
MSDPARSKPQLDRVVGVPGIAFAAFNSMVGVGIFSLPGLVAGLLGPAAIIAYLVCAVLICLLGLCFAEAGSRVKASGGLYAYASAAFGPVVGGVAGMLALIAGAIGSAAALARFFIDILASIWPALGNGGASLALLIAIYGTLALVNIAGARDGARLTVTIGLLKLTPLLAIVLVGVFAIEPVNLAWPAPPPVDRVGQGAMMLMLAFMGVECGLGLSGEARDPARTIPRALALALGGVAGLYLALQITAQGVLGPALAGTATPLADVAGKLVGPMGASLLLLATAISIGGFMVADMFSSPRTAFALAEAGQLPRWIARIHPTRHTPSNAIALYATAVVLVSASGSFKQLVVLTVSGTLLLYLIVCLGVLRLRAKDVKQAGPPFVAPGGAFVPTAAAVIIVWLLSTLAVRELVMGGAFVLATAVIYQARELRSRGATDRSTVPGS